MPSIIKASGGARPIEGVSFNFDDMTQKANQYLDEVRKQAAGILQQAKQDAAAIRAKAEEEGKQAALKAVERILDDKVAKQLATLLPALDKAVAGVVDARQAWLAHWERSAVHVAAAMAARIARRELERVPEITVALVREALELAAGSQDVAVHLNPDDHLALGRQVEQLTARVARLGKVKIIADPAVSRGGCRVETHFGSIDQQFETQLARIEQELTS